MTSPRNRGVGDDATNQPGPLPRPAGTGQRTDGRTSRPALAPMSRDERRARADLYPAGDVIAFPATPPIRPEAA